MSLHGESPPRHETEPAASSAPNRAGTRWWQRPLPQLALLISLGLGLYLPTLHAPFLFDDYPCIVENPAIRNFDFFLDFARIRELNVYADIKNNMALRPIAYLTFALNHHFGGPNVFGFHLVNLLVHLGNTLLLYLLVSVTLRRDPLRLPAERSTLHACLPLLVALLFVVHPLQTMAVSYIVQRFTSLATCFYLAALLLYVQARTTSASWVRRGAYGLALLLTVVAMKTKGIAFTLPVLILLYDFFFLAGSVRQRLAWMLPFFATLVILPGTLIWLVATDGIDDPRWKVDQAINLVNFSGLGHWDYLKTQFGVIVSYLRLLLLPVGQNFAHDYPLAGNFLAPRTFIPFLLLLTLLGTGVWLARRSWQRKERFAERLIAFGILWFFVTIAITSSVIPLDHLMVEYRVYLPSVGAFLAVAATALAAVDRGLLGRRLLVGCAALAIALLSGATVARNALYTDKIRLVEDIVSKSPAKLEARVELAYAYLEHRRFEAAIREYTTLVELLPNDPNMQVNLGYVYHVTGEAAAAMDAFRRALALKPESSLAHGNLGFVYLDLGRTREGERELTLALDSDPHYGAARERLARLYEDQGRVDAARAQYRALLQSYPAAEFARQRLRELGD